MLAKKGKTENNNKNEYYMEKAEQSKRSAFIYNPYNYYNNISPIWNQAACDLFYGFKLFFLIDTYLVFS